MILGPDAQAEVPQSVVQNIAVSGQIDRLCIADNHIVIADFKTGQPPANSADNSSYHRQLALYAALLAQMYPHPISAPIIWTRTSKKMFVTTEEQMQH